MDALEKYIVERDRALSSLDMEWAAQQMPYSAPEVRLLAMHKARCKAAMIAPKLQDESREWLRTNGYHQLNDGWPTLPETPNVKLRGAALLRRPARTPG